MEADPRQILDRVPSGDLDPIAAADQLRAGGQFMTGGVGLDTAMASPEETLRFQTMMGRLMWLFLVEAAGTDLPEPTSHEEYRDLLSRSITAEDESDSPS